MSNSFTAKANGFCGWSLCQRLRYFCSPPGTCFLTLVPRASSQTNSISQHSSTRQLWLTKASNTITASNKSRTTREELTDLAANRHLTWYLRELTTSLIENRWNRTSLITTRKTQVIPVKTNKRQKVASKQAYFLLESRATQITANPKSKTSIKSSLQAALKRDHTEPRKLKATQSSVMVTTGVTSNIL